MEVSLIGVRRRSGTAPTNDVRKTAIIADERSGALTAIDDLTHEVEVRTVLLGVRTAPGETHRHVLHAFHGLRLVTAISRIEDARASHRDFKSQGRPVAYGFHAEGNA